jgi:integrase
MKLTAKTIDTVQIPAGKAEVICYDSAIPGFGLRILAGGSRVLVFTYKYGGMTRRMTLGRAVPEAIGAIRKAAAELHHKVRLGGDPAQVRDDARQKATQAAVENFKAIADRFLAEHGKSLRPRTLCEVKRYLEMVAKPLHGRPISTIEKRDVASLLSSVASDRGPVASNRLAAALSKMFAWSMAEGLLEANPVLGTNRRPEKARERVLVDKDTGNAAELAQVWRALDDSIAGDIGKLLILTGCRHEEISGLRWEEIDEDFTRIKLPAGRTKGKRERVIPLSQPARQILARGPRVAGWKTVFSSSERGYKDMGSYKLAVNKRLPVDMEHWVWHDLRRSVDTGLSALGIAPHIVDEILGHKSSAKQGIRATYNHHTYYAEKAIALKVWAEHVMAAVSGEPAKIVPIRAA